MLTAVKTLFTDTLSLLFPQLCQACGNNLVGNEDIICTTCLYDLPYTNFHLQADNIVARQFWGKIKLESAYSFLYFTKGGSVQQLMHNFKYHNTPQIGYMLGKLAGKQLAESEVYNTIDFIIPVPLHPSRLRKRGYNQSEYYARGIAEKLNAEVLVSNLIRKKATLTQTHKNRLARFENMRSVFSLKDPAALRGKHVLLVDDIMTTGSTLEACAMPLIEVDGLKLSIATIAYAE
ncbi:ComF family protein [Mucilaginibacter ginkgonis]|uniref:ComF family protein n=1 Tax=Mucilaginibacter ginkgonis TaxID=2682091 RepID=A0A6I4HZD7_9SPHI|nr:ComF family protein [Mucilaginibacter ginkgonis]QQL48798.1 ComF family protein [Mucilaginibacter ginkgonis]